MTTAMKPGPIQVHATPDPALAARVVRRTPLLYEAGPADELDRPAHVRAGSGIARVGDRLVVVQDDANFLALIDPATALVHAVSLPAGEDGRRQFDDRRGNKHLKLDLEACFVAPDDGGEPVVVALGSGSTPRREQVVLAHDPMSLGEGGVLVRDARALYAALRADPHFAPGEMNVEGAVYAAGRVRVLGRGNGAAREGRASLNSTCELDWPTLRAYLADPGQTPPPEPERVIQYALGELDGLTLGFTDATVMAEHHTTVIFVAAAEDSPDATRDGRVAGSVIGVLESTGQARWTILTDSEGARLTAKVEGVIATSHDPSRFYVVIDQDDPDAPSELCDVELAGPWIAE